MGEVSQLKSAATGACADAAAPRNYVRVTCADHHGYIEFQFAIGDPELYLDMTLPPLAFAEFCARHQVLHLTSEQAAAVDVAARRWHAGDEQEESSRVD